MTDNILTVPDLLCLEIDVFIAIRNWLIDGYNLGAFWTPSIIFLSLSSVADELNTIIDWQTDSAIGLSSFIEQFVATTFDTLHNFKIDGVFVSGKGTFERSYQMEFG